MKLRIPVLYIGKMQLLKALFGKTRNRNNCIETNISNITFEPNDSLIIHSFKTIGISVAVKTNEDGSLRILFAPPLTESNYLDVYEDNFKPDKVFDDEMNPSKFKTIKRKRK